MKFEYIIEYPNRVIAIGTTINGLTFRGVAICSKEDIFNVKVGKQIARLRAEEKQLNNIKKNIDAEIDALLDALDKRNRRMEKLNKQLFKIETELEKI